VSAPLRPDAAPGSEDWPACAVCGRILDRVTGPAGVRYQHTDDDVDHLPVPVASSELPHVDLRCDFCFDPDPGWAMPVRDFRMEVLPGHGSLGEWLACDPCSAAIVRGDWPGLLRRTVASMTERHGPVPAEVVDGLRGLHRQLRRNALGLPVRRERAR
jgi:hypothetical protein